LRFNWCDATIVEPEPKNKSSIKSFSLVLLFKGFVISPKGFVVGCDTKKFPFSLNLKLFSSLLAKLELLAKSHTFTSGLHFNSFPFLIKKIGSNFLLYLLFE
jgi:hypothetical protein